LYERERERREKVGGVVIEPIFRGGNNIPALKVPRQCPLVLLGTALGSEEGKALGSGLN
jgi:hypothetical protein